MQKLDLTTILNDAENDLKSGLEQLIFVIKSIHEDVENLKVDL